MADFFQKITDMQGTVEDLVRKVPGFSGYFAKEDRRAADQLLRDHLVRVFEDSLAEFTTLQRRLIDAGGIMLMERVQRIDGLLRTFIDRIKTAADGYAGVFDAVKVKEAELERLYMFDNSLLAYQDQLATGLKAFEEAIGNESVEDVLRQLEEVVNACNEAFRARGEAMLGLQDAV